MHVVVKPWPFRGWAMDIVDKIYPTSSKIHSFILVTTNQWFNFDPFHKIVSSYQNETMYFR